MTPASRQFGRGQRSRGMKQQRSRLSQSNDPANQQENTDNWWKAEQQPATMSNQLDRNFGRANYGELFESRERCTYTLDEMS
jgi:hypothetical protein